MSSSVTTAWWFGDALLFVICGAVLAMAAILTPSPDVVSLFGVDVPILCTYRSLFGMPCPGCGMTRSFSFMAHGLLIDAFAVNKLGPFVFLLVASQVPYRAYTLGMGFRQRASA